MCTPTAWQLGEDMKGKLMPFLREVNELRGKIELEITHKQVEMEFGSVAIWKANNPVPEDPEKIKKLGENVIRALTTAMGQYERLCIMEANKCAVQETGQVTTTCPDVEENQIGNMVLPTPETECPSPFVVSPEVMDYADTVLPETHPPTKPVSPPSPRPRLQRGAAVENEETIDLGKQ